MEIATKYFGKVEIEPNNIINFESGIPGFIEERQFILMPMENTPFWIMQSVNTTEVAFVIVDPFVLFPSYEFKLNDEVQTKLQIESERDVAIFSILTVADPFNNTTANLKAPIVINDRTKLGKQIILQDDKYKTKHLINEQLTPSTEKGE